MYSLSIAVTSVDLSLIDGNPIDEIPIDNLSSIPGNLTAVDIVTLELLNLSAIIGFTLIPLLNHQAF